MNLNFTFTGKPIAKQRPRVLKCGITFDPQSKEKSAAKIDLASQFNECQITKPLECKMTFYTAIPASLSQKKRALLLEQYNPKRPDIDNYLKWYLDILNGVVIHDDSQIVCVYAEKRYSDKPRTEIFLREVQ